jgi:hypothetical protein
MRLSRMPPQYAAEIRPLLMFVKKIIRKTEDLADAVGRAKEPSPLQHKMAMRLAYRDALRIANRYATQAADQIMSGIDANQAEDTAVAIANDISALMHDLDAPGSRERSGGPPTPRPDGDRG